ncbi:MAG TPA: TIR domain-containing protein [Acidimicrobiales bacterium]|nr:TIR domain-containing protein [Acidimicrobiales bacterium]
MPLRDAIVVAQKIQDEASGTEVGRLTLAEILDVSPASSKFRELVAASRFYGLTSGGINASEFGLTDLGRQATGADEVIQVAALKRAVLTVEPFRAFLEAFNNKKVPSATVFRDYLVKTADVSHERATECMDFLLTDAETAGFLRLTKGGNYVDFAATLSTPEALDEDFDQVELIKEVLPGEEEENGVGIDESGEDHLSEGIKRLPDHSPKKVFIAHGKNRNPLEQLKDALSAFKVEFAVAVDEANKGRPISRKVAALMRDECSSGIFIFTADEKFLREIDGITEEVWRPSENVVYELGAASILYENRIVIFKESDVEFPSDFSDLGYIEFEKDQLGGELGALFKELVALDILEVRAKG